MEVDRVPDIAAVDQFDLEPVAYPAAQCRTRRAATEHPPRLHDAGSDLLLLLGHLEPDPVNPARWRGRQSRIVGLEPCRRLRHQIQIVSGAGRGRLVAIRVLRHAGRFVVDQHGEHHAHLAVAGDRAPTVQLPLHDADIQLRGLPRLHARRALAGLQHQVMDVVALVDDVDDQRVTGIHPDLVGDVPHPSHPDIHRLGVTCGDLADSGRSCRGRFRWRRTDRCSQGQQRHRYTHHRSAHSSLGRFGSTGTSGAHR